MSYDEVEIEDMKWVDELKAYTYTCPCGDLFQITLEELKYGEDIARCPSCSLYIKVIYDQDKFLDEEEDPEVAASGVQAEAPFFPPMQPIEVS